MFERNDGQVMYLHVPTGQIVEMPDPLTIDGMVEVATVAIVGRLELRHIREIHEFLGTYLEHNEVSHDGR